MRRSSSTSKRRAPRAPRPSPPPLGSARRRRRARARARVPPPTRRRADAALTPLSAKPSAPPLLRPTAPTPPTQVTPTASFEKDLGLDSLDVVELVMAFEEEFAVEIPDADADKIATVRDAVDYIAQHPMAK